MLLPAGEGVDSSQRISRIRMANWEQQILVPSFEANSRAHVSSSCQIQVDIIGWLIVNGLVKDLCRWRYITLKQEGR